MIAVLALLACVKTLPPNAADAIDAPALACAGGSTPACDAVLADAAVALQKLQVACDAEDEKACRLLRTHAPLAVSIGAGSAHIGDTAARLPENAAGNILAVRNAVPEEHAARAVVTVAEDASVQAVLAVLASLDQEGVHTASIGLPDGAATVQVATTARLGAPAPLSRAQVQQVIADNSESLQACYAQQPVGDAPLRVLLQLQIAEDGTPEQVEIAPMGEAAEGLRACLIEAARTLPFPGATAPTQIRFPVTLQPE